MRTRVSCFVMAAAVAASFLLPACTATPEVVPSAGPRPPVSADAVKLYQTYPQRYEELKLVTLLITPETTWNERGDANAAFEALKAQAAAVGANGLLLTVGPAEHEAMVTAAYHGTYYQVPMRTAPKTAVAQAIYVLEE